MSKRDKVTGWRQKEGGVEEGKKQWEEEVRKEIGNGRGLGEVGRRQIAGYVYPSNHNEQQLGYK